MYTITHLPLSTLLLPCRALLNACGTLLRPLLTHTQARCIGQAFELGAFLGASLMLIVRIVFEYLARKDDCTDQSVRGAATGKPQSRKRTADTLHPQLTSCTASMPITVGGEHCLYTLPLALLLQNGA